MKSSSPLTTLFLLTIILLPVLYVGFIYNGLPETIPTHFGLDGKPDDYSKKSALLLIVGLFTAITVGTYYLLKYLPRIDPKKTANYAPEIFTKLAVVMAVFLSAINLVIIYASANGSINISKLLLPLVGLFFACLGNLMHSIKPNYFAGIRTPWTLESEDTWRATHQLAGKLWVVGGIAVTILTLVLPPAAATIVFIVTLVSLGIIPVIYSYRYFKKNNPSK